MKSREGKRAKGRRDKKKEREKSKSKKLPEVKKGTMKMRGK